ncbi:hypothetical protein CCR75_001995 [Bremia lactucae]|uniref:Uncharacterized protein n=1 Tax=Bremia lactucae TaxID=4779 RepID=A0A976P0A0_BRELC|nr:hypothetical protein CCR75_001995 [Bremia lactucae]
MSGINVFRALLVVKDTTGSRVKLKRSKRHGQLTLDVNSQSAQLVYPRVGRFYHCRFEQPRKCVMGKKLMRVYSSNGKDNFTEKYYYELKLSIAIGGRRGQVFRDAPKFWRSVQACVLTYSECCLQLEVIAVNESMLERPRQTPNVHDAIIAGGELALQAIRDTNPKSMVAEFLEYQESSQLQEDTDAIMRSLFDVNT